MEVWNCEMGRVCDKVSGLESDVDEWDEEREIMGTMNVDALSDKIEALEVFLEG